MLKYNYFYLLALQIVILKTYKHLYFKKEPLQAKHWGLALWHNLPTAQYHRPVKHHFKKRASWNIISSCITVKTTFSDVLVSTRIWLFFVNKTRINKMLQHNIFTCHDFYFLYFYNSFIEMCSKYEKSLPFSVYDSITFIIFTEMFRHHYYLVLAYFYTS